MKVLKFPTVPSADNVLSFQCVFKHGSRPFFFHSQFCSLASNTEVVEKIFCKFLQIISEATKMSGSDTTLYNQSYQTIERPFKDVDLSKVPWEIVIKIMEQQAQMVRNANTEQLMPQPIINFEYRTSPYNYSQNCSTEESDQSSCFSEDMSSPTEPSQSDISQSESDIEIDVDSVEEENDDYFMSSLDNIPITVLQLETKLREKERREGTESKSK